MLTKGLRLELKAEVCIKPRVRQCQQHLVAGSTDKGCAPRDAIKLALSKLKTENRGFDNSNSSWSRVAQTKVVRRGVR